MTAAVLAALLSAAAPVSSTPKVESATQKAAGIVVKQLDGAPVPLQPLLAAPGGAGATLLVFWASWCKPCLHEIPVLNELQRFHQDKGFRVLGLGVTLGVGTIDDAKALAKKEQIKYSVLFDSEGTAEKAFGIVALPTMFLLDSHGGVLWSGNTLPPDINARISAAAQPGEDRGSK